MRESTFSITTLPYEIIRHIFSFLPPDDADAFAETCTLLSTLYWEYYPSQIRWHRVDPVVYLFREIIELNDKLKQAWLKVPHEAHPLLLDVAYQCEPIAVESFQHDPNSAWKLAVLGGFYNLVKEYLGDKINTTRDSTFRGVLAYLAARGDVESIQHFIAVYYPEGFSIEDEDPTYELAKMAAMKGGIDTLVYLRDELGYDLTVVREITEETHESLLNYAVQGGCQKMVAFLLQEGVPMTEKQNLPFDMARWNQWHLFEMIDPEKECYKDKIKRLRMASDACHHGHITLVRNILCDDNSIPKTVQLEAVRSGHSEIFWYFVAEGWINIEDWMSFSIKPLTHHFACRGFLHLINQITHVNDKSGELDYV
ncbi:MAG: F-box protein, partial [Coxiellaceae bacterium]|nr:F-box protein [Coxiellaceae bacterium]